MTKESLKHLEIVLLPAPERADIVVIVLCSKPPSKALFSLPNLVLRDPISPVILLRVYSLLCATTSTEDSLFMNEIGSLMIS